jgi:hypothetical protein
MNPRNFPRRKAARRARSTERAEARDGRSAKQQLQRLERRGHARCKEADRLRAVIAAGREP